MLKLERVVDILKFIILILFYVKEKLEFCVEITN